MPATPTFPAPSADVCPACGGIMVNGRCSVCSLEPHGELAGTIWWIDGDLHTLACRRDALLSAESSVARLVAAEGRTFPAPALLVCPACDGPAGEARCARCGLELDGDVGSMLWQIDTELHRLTSERAAVVIALQTASRPVPVGASAPAQPFEWAGRGAKGEVIDPGVPPRADHAQQPVAPESPPAPPPVNPESADRGRARGGARRLQFLLLSLGALCLVVAVIAFGAVAWGHLGAAAKGAVLGGATMVAVAAALGAHHRGLRATAEALFTVAAAGALVDIHAVHMGVLADTPDWKVWAIGTAVVALAAWTFDRIVPLVAARSTALVVAQLPGLFLADGLDSISRTFGPSLSAAVLVVQAAVVLGLLRAGGDRLHPRGLAAIPAVGAAVAWTAGTGLALVLVLLGFPTSHDGGFLSHSHNPWYALAVFVAAGLVAAQVALTWDRVEGVRVLAMMAAATMAIGAASFGLSFLGPVQPGWTVVALAGAATVTIGAALPNRWRLAPAVVGTTAAAMASTGMLPGLVEALMGVGSAASGAPWQGGFDSVALGLIDHSPAVNLGATAIALLAPALIAAVAWWRNVARPVAIGAMAATAAVATVIVPLATAAPVWVAAGLPFLVGIGALAVAAERRTTRFVATPAGLTCLVVSAAWASVSAMVTIDLLGSLLACAVVLACSAERRSDQEAALGSTALALAAAGGLAGTLAAVFGATVAQGWFAVTLTLSAGSFLGWAMVASIEPDGDNGESSPRTLLLRRVGYLIEGAAVVIHLSALIVASGTDAAVASWILLSGAVVMAAHATRPDRRWLVSVAVAEGLAFLWLRLSIADVALVEAYTMPLALILLLAGGLALRRNPQRSSWETIGPGLALALAPTVLVALVEPGSVRPLAATVAGALVLLAGVRGRFQAGVTIGAIAVGVVATRQLFPAAAGLPPFLVFGTIGAVLLGLGATFEQRRRDLTDLRDRFATLR